jgi:hypothetical protein
MFAEKSRREVGTGAFNLHLFFFRFGPADLNSIKLRASDLKCCRVILNFKGLDLIFVKVEVSTLNDREFKEFPTAVG